MCSLVTESRSCSGDFFADFGSVTRTNKGGSNVRTEASAGCEVSAPGLLRNWVQPVVGTKSLGKNCENEGSGLVYVGMVLEELIG